jgi:hypothetical protein
MSSGPEVCAYYRNAVHPDAGERSSGGLPPFPEGSLSSSGGCSTSTRRSPGETLAARSPTPRSWSRAARSSARRGSGTWSAGAGPVRPIHHRRRPAATELRTFSSSLSVAVSRASRLRARSSAKAGRARSGPRRGREVPVPDGGVEPRARATTRSGPSPTQDCGFWTPRCCLRLRLVSAIAQRSEQRPATS